MYFESEGVYQSGVLTSSEMTANAPGIFVQHANQGPMLTVSGPQKTRSLMENVKFELPPDSKSSVNHPVSSVSVTPPSSWNPAKHSPAPTTYVRLPASSYGNNEKVLPPPPPVDPSQEIEVEDLFNTEEVGYINPDKTNDNAPTPKFPMPPRQLPSQQENQLPKPPSQNQPQRFGDPVIPSSMLQSRPESLVDDSMFRITNPQANPGFLTRDEELAWYQYQYQSMIHENRTVMRVMDPNMPLEYWRAWFVREEREKKVRANKHFWTSVLTTGAFVGEKVGPKLSKIVTRNRFELKLQGWSREMSADSERFSDTLDDISRMYGTFSDLNPMLRLGFFMLVSALQTHADNKAMEREQQEQQQSTQPNGSRVSNASNMGGASNIISAVGNMMKMFQTPQGPSNREAEYFDPTKEGLTIPSSQPKPESLASQSKSSEFASVPVPPYLTPVRTTGHLDDSTLSKSLVQHMNPDSTTSMQPSEPPLQPWTNMAPENMLFPSTPAEKLPASEHAKLVAQEMEDRREMDRQFEKVHHQTRKRHRRLRWSDELPEGEYDEVPCSPKRKRQSRSVAPYPPHLQQHMSKLDLVNLSRNKDGDMIDPPSPEGLEDLFEDTAPQPPPKKTRTTKKHSSAQPEQDKDDDDLFESLMAN